MVVATAPGCLGFGDRGSPNVTELGQEAVLSLVELETYNIHGLSDLTRELDAAAPQQLWAIPEQTRVLVPIAVDRGTGPRVLTPARPIVGVAPHLDTESVTALGPAEFVLGTETREAGRPFDSLVIVRGSDAPGSTEPLRVTDTLEMPYALWPGFVAKTNEGIEGLCAVDTQLWATSETVGQDALGQRFAPLGRYDRQTRDWVGYALALTSKTGRISALQCRPHPDQPDTIELIALERHYEVARVLRFTMPRAVPHSDRKRAPERVVPEILLDLSRMVQPLVNFEGIAWGADDDLWLVSDNYMGFVRGPTYMLHVRAHPGAHAP